MIKLTLTEKGGEPKLLTFDKDEITIGRVSGNDIVLAKLPEERFDFLGYSAANASC